MSSSILGHLEPNTIRELERIKEEWDTLVASDPTGSVFDTAEWLSAFVNTRPQNFAVPLIFAYREDGELRGAAAFRLRKKSVGFGPLEKTVLEFLSQGPSDYNAILMSSNGDRQKSSRMLRDFLIYRCPHWDEMNLRDAHPDSKAPSIIDGIGIRLKELRDHMTPYLPLPSSWETYSASLGRKLRHNLKGYERNLRRDFPDFEIVVRDQPSINELRDFFDLHQMRMKHLSKKGAFFDQTYRAFHERFVQSACQKGWIRLHLLKIRGENVAAQYGFVFKNRYCFYLSGFDPSYGKYSVQSLVTAETIRGSINEKLGEYDFLRGRESYKLRWTESARYNRRVRMNGRRPASLLKMVIANLMAAF